MSTESTCLTHYGVKGMRWGIRKAYNNAFTKAKAKARQKEHDKIKTQLVADSRSVTAKAPRGKHLSVTGRYGQTRNGKAYVASHIVDDRGNVKMSYLRGKHGDVYIATAKSYIDKNLNLKEHFRTPPSSREIEYDVYK